MRLARRGRAPDVAQRDIRIAHAAVRLDKAQAPGVRAIDETGGKWHLRFGVTGIPTAFMVLHTPVDVCLRQGDQIEAFNTRDACPTLEPCGIGIV